MELATYPEALSQLGYYNALVGKWHFVYKEYLPTKHGFDMQIGVPNDVLPQPYYRPYFREDPFFSDDNNRYPTDRLTCEAVNFIGLYDKNSPFVLTFSYYSVHSPHIGREDLVSDFKAKA